jgi:hypothetical protein
MRANFAKLYNGNGEYGKGKIAKFDQIHTNMEEELLSLRIY